MSQDILGGDVHVRGTLSAATFTPPSGCISNSHVSASAGIAATKLEHQFAVQYTTAAGSAVATATHPLHIVRGTTGEIVSVEVICTTAPTSSDTVTVMLQRSTGGGAFANALSGNISLSSSSTARVAYAGTLSVTDLVDGDILQVVVTASGTSCQGLCVVVTLREDAT
jgi:hypothetical protein